MVRATQIGLRNDGDIGQTYEVKVELVKSARLPTKNATGELKIAASPSRAVVFVDGQYAGHVRV